MDTWPPDPQKTARDEISRNAIKHTIGAVSVPKEFEPLFSKAEEYAEHYFATKIENPKTGTIEISNERYVLVRAASMSTEFFDLVTSLYKDRGTDEAHRVASGLLYDMGHAIGKADAKAFHQKLKITDPIEKLSLGPLHFAYSGWAYVHILPESRPTRDDDYLLVYDHPFSFEADTWIRNKRQVDFPVCIMNAGYSSGWCEESFDLPLVAKEITCRAKGDAHCRFVMATPHKIREKIKAFAPKEAVHSDTAPTLSIPEFFERKRLEDELRKARDELEQRVEERTAELAARNRQLEREITERKRAEKEKYQLEAKLLVSQKREAIGTLAGGVAHDFNNLLMTIQGNTSIMLNRVKKEDPFAKMLGDIEYQIERGATLVHQLLGYASKGVMEIKPVDLNELVLNTSETLRRTRKDISINYQLEPALPPVKADEGQIERVILNLFVNAADAMPNGGSLNLSTRIANKNDCKNHIYIIPGQDYAIFNVSDNGIGMTEHTAKRIFDPFFTTKEIGRGTGLGLASAYGILEKHRGAITAVSKLGEGTTFSVFLPLTKESASKTTEIPPDLAEGSETVLFVDDETSIVDVASQMIENLGYRVFQATSGEEAIDIFQGRHSEIDLVILDIIMPSMGAGEIFDKIKEINPDIKVLLASGFSQNAYANKILERGGNGFIHKPFNSKQISKKLREILDSQI